MELGIEKKTALRLPYISFEKEKLNQFNGTISICAAGYQHNIRSGDEFWVVHGVGQSYRRKAINSHERHTRGKRQASTV